MWVRTVDRSTLVPDDSLSIDQGAVSPWNTLMWSLMTDVCRAMGVRTDVPFRDLTDEEKHIVYDGPAVKKHILYHAKNSNDVAELDFTYFSAVHTVENALSKVKDEKGMKRVEKFLREDLCPDCGGTRLSDAARAPRLRGIGLDEACQMPLSDLTAWVEGVPDTLPRDMRPMAERICEAFQGAARRLMDLGLGYLTLDRAASTLSTGERQRIAAGPGGAQPHHRRPLCAGRALHRPPPGNLRGLTAVMDDLVSDGNSVLLVDHDTQVLSHADWIVELGPEAGAEGGRVLAQGTVAELAGDPASRIGPFLRQDAPGPGRPRCPWGEIFDLGTIHLSTGAIHTVKPLETDIPKGRLTVVTGVSGSGKTTLVLESLVPALEAMAQKRSLPAHVLDVTAPDIQRVKLIDATPIGITCAPRWRRMPMSTTSCGRSGHGAPRPRPWDTRPGTSPTTRESSAAPPATAPARSAWTCSFFRTWTSPAPTAGAAGTAGTRSGH